MKDFNYMSSSEISALTQEEFDSISPFKKRSCYNCKSLKAIVSLWCTNIEAKKARGTSIPGCIKCPYWSPAWSEIPLEYHTVENGFVIKQENPIIQPPIPKTKSIILKFFQSCLHKLK